MIIESQSTDARDFAGSTLDNLAALSLSSSAVTLNAAISLRLVRH